MRMDCSLSLERGRLGLSNCYGTTSWEVLSAENEDVDRSKSKLRMNEKLIFAIFKGDCDKKNYFNDRVV